MKRTLLLIVLLALLGCTQPEPTPTAPPASADLSPTMEPASTATLRLLPTPLPTTTASASPLPSPTRPPPTPDATMTPINFEEAVVELRYTIPGLSLDRSLVGNVSSQILVTDEVSGRAEIRRNQPGILIELQQALPGLTLDALPDGCDFCVQLSYELPLTGDAAAGWLQDETMLASIENYMAVVLGPHFPADTIIGLRRSASPYDIAHTLALTIDGRFWFWTATEAELNPPVQNDIVTQALLAELQRLPVADLQPRYTVACTGSPFESFFLSTPAAEIEMFVVCPEVALPAALVPLYDRLNELAQERLPDDGLPAPAPLVPLNALLDYHRQDGSRLTLYRDGLAVAADPSGALFSGNLGVTEVLSLTNALIDGGRLSPGVGALAAAEKENILLIRGPLSLYDAGWDEGERPALAAQVESLDELFEQLLAGLFSSPDVDSPPTAIPEATATPEANAEPSPTP